MSAHVDHLDALGNLFTTPVWYMVENDTLVGVLQLEESDTWGYRRRAEAQYPNAVAWNYNHLGWCYMIVNKMRGSIWAPASSVPEVVLMAKLLEF